MRFILAMLLMAGTAGAVQAGEDAFMFLTPSGNIGCQFGMSMEASVYCVRRDAAQSTAEVPVLNAYVQLPEQGKAITGPFEGDAWYPTGAQVLKYGKSRSDFGSTCKSAKSGLTCTRGAHGFSVNRKTIKVW